MRTRFAFVIGAGLGYVLGTRAGRERYDALADRVAEIWRHPKVQQQVEGVEEAIDAVVHDHVPTLARRAAHTAREAMGLELPND